MIVVWSKVDYTARIEPTAGRCARAKLLLSEACVVALRGWAWHLSSHRSGGEGEQHADGDDIHDIPMIVVIMGSWDPRLLSWWFNVVVAGSDIVPITYVLHPPHPRHSPRILIEIEIIEIDWSDTRWWISRSPDDNCHRDVVKGNTTRAKTHETASQTE